jgi:hypothetical protein
LFVELMRSQISEFSYGYALTEKLVRRRGDLITDAPLFPSLREEGKQGFGYDVKIDLGTTVFIQFKLSEFLNTRRAKEIRKYALNPPLKLPIYRMKLRSSKYSNQHASLLSLEKKGESVYYAAPIFHKPKELRDFYLRNQVIENTVFIRPSQIGEITDDKEHDVSFSPSLNYGYRLSSPHPIPNILSSGRFIEEVERKISESPIRFGPNFNTVIFERLTEQILRAVPPESDSLDSYLRGEIESMAPLQGLALATQAFLGSQIFFIGRNES